MEVSSILNWVIAISLIGMVFGYFVRCCQKWWLSLDSLCYYGYPAYPSLDDDEDAEPKPASLPPHPHWYLCRIYAWFTG